MSRWTEELTAERQRKAKGLYEKLSSVGWDQLSKNDQVIFQLLAWFCLDGDEDPSGLVEHDFTEGA